jgi:hypothetical protein
MTLPIIPDGFCAAFKLNLADRPEAVVGDKARVLGKIDANVTRIFVKFDKSAFAENFKYRPVGKPVGIWRAGGHGYRAGNKSLAHALAGARGNRNFTMTAK